MLHFLYCWNVNIATISRSCNIGAYYAIENFVKFWWDLTKIIYDKMQQVTFQILLKMDFIQLWNANVNCKHIHFEKCKICTISIVGIVITHINPSMDLKSSFTLSLLYCKILPTIPTTRHFSNSSKIFAFALLQDVVSK